MQVKPGQFITAITHYGKVIQGGVRKCNSCSYIMYIDENDVEDYNDDVESYIKPLDDGTIYNVIHVLEVANSMAELKIDPATVPVPPKLAKFPFEKVYDAGLDIHDAKVFHQYMESPAAMYTRYIANGHDIDAAANQYFDDQMNKWNGMNQAIADALGDFCDNFNIDSIEDEYGNTIAKKK